jgi:hypothetical protein
MEDCIILKGNGYGLRHTPFAAPAIGFADTPRLLTEARLWLAPYALRLVSSKVCD